MSEVKRHFQPLFYPRSVAVVGASNTPHKWGSWIMDNLVNSRFKGKIVPINRNGGKIFGREALPSIKDLPVRPDLGIVIVPPPSVVPALKELIDKGVKSALIITAGFGETGSEGAAVEAEIARLSSRADIPVIGPNCQGLMNVRANLYAQAIDDRPPSGSLSIVSQSGNVGGSLIRFGSIYGIGFNKFVSSGNEAKTGVEELIEYYGEDGTTKAILIYVEGVKNGQAFLKACRRVGVKKPVVALKGGLTEAGSKACASHTGSMAGAAGVFANACQQAGVILVDDLDELFHAGSAIVAHPPPRGNRVGIISLAGGWGVLAADACAREGLEVVTLSDKTIARFNEFLADRWSHGNPVDPATTPGRDIMKQCLQIMAECDEVDCIMQTHLGFGGTARKHLKILREQKRKYITFTEKDAEQAEKRDLALARFIVGLAKKYRKPIISCSDMALGSSPEGNPTLEYMGKQGMPVYPSPAKAARILGKIVQYEKWRRRAK
jgi:acyl-CoA synthetase (NDP forming)